MSSVPVLFFFRYVSTERKDNLVVHKLAGFQLHGTPRQRRYAPAISMPLLGGTLPLFLNKASPVLQFLPKKKPSPPFINQCFPCS